MVRQAAPLVWQVFGHDEGLTRGVLKQTELDVRGGRGAAEPGLLPGPHLHTLQARH